MAYLIRTKEGELLFIHYAPRNGLYYRRFTDHPSPRTTTLASNSMGEYTAVLDNQKDLHVIYKNTKQQIIHMRPFTSGGSGRVILDDINDQYKICNLYACFLDQELHLFYNALHPETSQSELIHHCFSSEPQRAPHALGMIPNLGTSYQCIVSQDKIFLLSIFQETQYSLNIHTYEKSTQKWIPPTIISNSSFPISHSHCCLHPSGQLHLLYTQEKYGQYQLYYVNDLSDHTNPVLLYSCAHPIQPFFIYYRQGLWIHWLEGDQCKIMLSVDEGKTFSAPQRASLPTSDPVVFHYTSPTHTTSKILSCSQIYGTLLPHPSCAILAPLDMDQLHPYLPTNEELKLYISKYTSIPLQNKSEEEELEALIEENKELKELQESITEQYNELYRLANELQEEGKKWRDRYYALQQQEKLELRKERSRRAISEEVLPLNEEED